MVFSGFECCPEGFLRFQFLSFLVVLVFFIYSGFSSFSLTVFTLFFGSLFLEIFLWFCMSSFHFFMLLKQTMQVFVRGQVLFECLETEGLSMLWQLHCRNAYNNIQ